MAPAIGVVGPRDLVDTVADYCSEQGGITALSFDYAHESEATSIVAAQAAHVAGWLFTGIGPYTRAERDQVIDRPAVYLPYTREALQLAIIGLLRSGQRADRFSVDTMSHHAVQRCLEQAGIDRSDVRVLPFRPDLRAADYAEFHRRAHADEPAATHAITCLSSVDELVRDELPTIRLRPTAHAIRSTLEHLILNIDESALGHAQIVIGLMDVPGAARHVEPQVAELAGAIGRRPDGSLLIATTRGQLAQASQEFTDLPLLTRLAELGDHVHVGFGLGRTAAEAEHLARRALIRSRRVGPVAAVLSRRNDTDTVLAELKHTAAPPLRTVDELARQSGIAAATLTAIGDLHLADQTVTAAHLAARLGLQARSARRTLAKLEAAGLAERLGDVASGARGRPATRYRILLPPTPTRG